VPVNSFDERIAARYQALWAELREPAVVEPAVDFLAKLAGPGPALELGIGIGRVALPPRRHTRCRATALGRLDVAARSLVATRQTPRPGRTATRLPGRFVGRRDPRGARRTNLSVPSDQPEWVTVAEAAGRLSVV
jgi:hypothetical protein